MNEKILVKAAAAVHEPPGAALNFEPTLMTEWKS
jgi:hypothetical protein